MKEYILKNTITLQVDILANFGNSGYQKVSKDFHLYNIPKELYDLWYTSIDFSFLNLIDIHRIKYFSNKELLEYYSQLVLLRTKLAVIFNNISSKKEVKKLKPVYKTNFFNKLFSSIKRGR